VVAASPLGALLINIAQRYVFTGHSLTNCGSRLF
jgi:hypothetical protein